MVRDVIDRFLRRTREARGCGPDLRYRLGVSSNLFSGALPEGIYYPDFTTLRDHRPLEFIALAGQALGKPWTKCTLIDVGCGEGTSTTAIGRTGARVIGIDGRPEVIARAKYLRDRLGYTNVDFRVGNVLDSSLWERADAVFVSGLIHHLEQPFQLMELIGRYCADLAYFCTHLAPGDEAQRAASHFSKLLHEPGVVEFRGRRLPGIRFLEGGSARETGLRRRRHPRAGIGNIHSWWPTEESFVSVMNAVGFPRAKRIAANDRRLRYRLCFRRSGEIAVGADGDQSYLWDQPQRPSPEVAADRARAADIEFLRKNRITPAVLGDPEATASVCSGLLAENIRPAAIYQADTGATTPGLIAGDGTFRPSVRALASLARDGPEFVVLAASRLDDLKSHIGDLVTLRACRYAFTSFTLPEIREFPALADPVTGEPVADRFPSAMRY
ncbi:MAG: class I SAM-dependent methyltransferase [Burkholderiales bacterium]